MNVKNLTKLVDEAQAIEILEAKEAGMLGYMARVMVQATMPHKSTPGAEFRRSNGILTLTILSPSDVGLPYGTYPRLLLAWITSEAVKTKSPELVLGPTLSNFMSQLGLLSTGGRWGTIGRLKDQMQRLFSSTISARMEAPTETLGMRMGVAVKYRLWWDPKSPEQAALWLSTVSLSHDFYREIIDRPVPIDMRAFQVLKKSPLALDIYCWLTYRLSYMKTKTEIPWPALRAQFGAGYPETPQGQWDFKHNFLKQLRSVLVVYPEAKVSEGDTGLLLKPSKPHIPLIAIP
jgi:hypothetical protein